MLRLRGSGGGSGRGFESRRRRPASPATSPSPAMDAAPEEGPAGTEAEPDGLPCPEPSASRLSAVELDRELDSRSELVRRHFRAGAARAVPCPLRPVRRCGWRWGSGPCGRREGNASARTASRRAASSGAGIGRHGAARPALPCLTPGRARRERPGRNVPP